MGDDLLNDVRTWLKGGGYVLEMQVARQVRAFTQLVFQGYPYLDPVTHKEREGDVAAFFPLDVDEEHLHVAHVVIECKDTTAPWVCFARTMAGNGPYTPWDCFDNECPGCLSIESGLEALAKDMRSAYSVTQKRSGRSESKDMAYEGVQQAVSAALATVANRPDDYTEGAVPDGVRRASGATIPVVVTTSPLMLAMLDESGELALEEVDRVALSVPRLGLPDDADSVVVIVIRQRALDDLLEEINRLGTSVVST